MEKDKNSPEDLTATIWEGYVKYHYANNGISIGLYKTESIKYDDGKYQPGTEDILYIGNSKDNALASFETAICEEGRGKIVSEFIPAEGRWELVKEE